MQIISIEFNLKKDDEKIKFIQKKKWKKSSNYKK